jgi:cytochrome P450
VFADPDALVPGRDPNPHLAFGIGPHRCIGAAFARHILRAVLPVCVRLRPAGASVRRASSYQRGYATMPIAIGAISPV